MKTKIVLTSLVLLAVSGILNAQKPEVGVSFSDRMNTATKAIGEKYRPQIEALQKEGKEVASDMKQPVKFDLTVKWNNKNMSLDLPQVTMKNRDIKLDLPQMEMKMQDYSFDVPSTRPKRVTVGQYPEFHGFTVRMKDIIITVQEPYMKRVTIKTKVPQFKMETVRIVVKVPEFKMARTDFVMKVPEFYADEINLLLPLSTGGNKQKLERIKSESEKIAVSMNKDVADALVAAQKAEATSVTTAMIDNINDASKTVTTSIEQTNVKVQTAAQSIDKFAKEQNGQHDPKVLQDIQNGMKSMNTSQQGINDALTNTLKEIADMTKTAIDKMNNDDAK